MAWARRVLDEEFSPGEFWSWLNMEAKRGILALWLLHGKATEVEAVALA